MVRRRQSRGASHAIGVSLREVQQPRESVKKTCAVRDLPEKAKKGKGKKRGDRRGKR
jgi:hypothetical protein